MSNESFYMTRDEALDNMIEIEIDSSDSFNILRETLERIGIASRQENTLYQSVHILHKQGRYYLAHFKEMFLLDGKPSTLTEEDTRRRNRIAALLQGWGLLTIVEPEMVVNQSDLNKIKILSKKERSDWNIVSKYSIGGSNKKNEKEAS